MVVCFTVVRKVKVKSFGYFEWRDRKTEDPFEPICKMNFSMPPWYVYTLKETDEQFKSYHDNRHQAYAEYLSTKNKENKSF